MHITDRVGIASRLLVISTDEQDRVACGSDDHQHAVVPSGARLAGLAALGGFGFVAEGIMDPPANMQAIRSQAPVGSCCIGRLR